MNTPDKPLPPIVRDIMRDFRATLVAAGKATTDPDVVICLAGAAMMAEAIIARDDAARAERAEAN